MSRKERQARAAQWCARLGQGAMVFFACLIMILPQKANAAPTSSPQPTTPPGWLTYTNPLFGYRIAYPPSWHFADGDPRSVQEFTFFSQTNAQGSSDEFPATGTDAKVEVYQYQKPATTSLDQWIAALDDTATWKLTGANAPVAGNGTLAGHQVTIMHRESAAPRVITEYVDLGNFVYVLSAYWSSGADSASVKQMLASFNLVTKPTTTQAGTPPIRTSPALATSYNALGLNLPLQIDHASYSSNYGGWMPSQSMNGGGVNTWFDHSRPDYGCDGSLTRYDGTTQSSSYCVGNSGGSCVQSVGCYSGHNGIDFSTGGKKDAPVYAAQSGTVSISDPNKDAACGTGLYVYNSTTQLKQLYCHLDSFASGIQAGTYVYQGQQIALSGDSGGAAGAPHLHFSVFDISKLPPSGWTSSSYPPIDPFGWSGSGTDPWGVTSGTNACRSGTQLVACDRGYLWTTGTQGSPAPSFVGGTITAVTPVFYGPGQWWYYQSSDAYGVPSNWTYSNSGASPTNYGIWNAPTGLNTTCAGAEVWIPSGDATATTAKYVISFSDGTANQTVTVNQNNYTSWYTIYVYY